jgi:exosortase K
VKTKLCVLAVMALFVWSMKRHYSDAYVDDLWWMLNPTAQAVGVTTGTEFAMEPGEGYLSRERRFLIEKSCAGINFMIAAFGMLVLALLHRVTSALSGAAVLGISAMVSYGAAVLVNSTRIVIAMWLATHPIASSSMTAADVHRFEGIAVYFVGLIALYELAQRLDPVVVAARDGL